MLELNHLRIFFEVAKDGRFTETAKRLNISQSALSRSVALLEEREGVKLFERSQRGVALTPVGAEIFRHCEYLFQTVTKIQETCRGTQEVCDGPLRFATTDHILNYLLPLQLQSFRDEFARVVPSVSIGSPDEIVAAVLKGECEFGLSFAKVLTPQIDYEGLSEEPMALVVHADVWRQCRASNQAATLSRVLDKVGYISSIGAITQGRPQRVLLELFGKTPHIGFETNSQEAQKRICLAGGGIAYLSRFMVEDEIKSGLLHEVNVEHAHSFKLWLATRKGSVMSLPSRLFVERLRTLYAKR